MSETQHIERSYLIEPDQESAEIAEAFGIEAGYEKQIVDVELPAELPQITYVTGESGCGKTTLLRELGGDIEPPSVPNTPLYTWADDTESALRLLSQVGLGDATLFVSRYSELSDSQQFRAKLYHRLLNTDGTIYVDEFLSTLDRETAKPVAYVFGKVCRRLDRKIVVSEPHDDLEEYLQPDLVIRGRAFPSRWNIYSRDSEAENPFWDDYYIEEKDADWYNNCRLGELHYKGKYTGGVKEHWACYHDNMLVGLLVSTYRMWDEGRRISRLVTHPSYRGCGAGQYLVNNYLDEFPAADTVAAMAKYNPVFERAGMERVEDSERKPPSGIKSELDGAGFDRDSWFSKEYCINFMEDRENREMIAQYADEISYFVSPGGDYLDESEVREKLLSEPQTSGRVLWNIRPKSMAKFVGPEADS